MEEDNIMLVCSSSNNKLQRRSLDSDSSISNNNSIIRINNLISNNILEVEVLDLKDRRSNEWKANFEMNEIIEKKMCIYVSLYIIPNYQFYI